MLTDLSPDQVYSNTKTFHINYGENYGVFSDKLSC